MNFKLLPIIILLSIIACTQNKESSETPDPEKSRKDRNLDLLVVLDTIWRTEQNPIRLRDSLGRVHGFESEEFKAQDEIYHQNHAINEAKVREILDTEGWPDISVIGEQGNITIANVIQHSDNDIRLKYLPMMKDAVQNKGLQPRLLARAEDRIATEAGKPQIYGGQIKYYPETQSFDVWPIADPANVDKRRAEIGLEPMAEFLAGRRTPMEWDLEKQIRRTQEFEKNRKQDSNN